LDLVEILGQVERAVVIGAGDQLAVGVGLAAVNVQELRCGLKGLSRMRLMLRLTHSASAVRAGS
jgi:hypothetical protein